MRNAYGDRSSTSIHRFIFLTDRAHLPNVIGYAAGGVLRYGSGFSTFELKTFHTSGRSSMAPSRSRSCKADLFLILYDLAHIAGWNPYNMHDLMHDLMAHVSWVGSVLLIRRSCATSHNGRWRTRWSRSWSIWSVRGVQYFRWRGLLNLSGVYFQYWLYLVCVFNVGRIWCVFSMLVATTVDAHSPKGSCAVLGSWSSRGRCCGRGLHFKPQRGGHCNRGATQYTWHPMWSACNYLQAIWLSLQYFSKIRLLDGVYMEL